MVVPGSKGTQGRLRDDCVTMAEVLGDAGYFTIMTGKWHLGQEHGTPPWKRGFERSLSATVGELYFPNQQQRREDGITSTASVTSSTTRNSARTGTAPI